MQATRLSQLEAAAVPVAAPTNTVIAKGRGQKRNEPGTPHPNGVHAKRAKKSEIALEIDSSILPGEALSLQQRRRTVRDRSNATQYLNITAAAEAVGLSKGVIATWVSQGMIASLKPGSANSHHLVDMHDLDVFMQRKRRPAMPRQLPGGPTGSGADPSRTLLYTRLDPEVVASLGVTTQEETNALLKQEQLQAARLANLDMRLPVMHGAEVAPATDYNRPHFQLLMELVLERKIDTIVVMREDRLCPKETFPLLEWLCRQNYVTIVCARSIAAAAAATAFADSMTPSGVADAAAQPGAV